MFNSTILDVAVGLSFVFLTVSLATSAVSEAISGMMKWRSATLLRGIKDLLNDQQLTGLAAQLYQHALINPRNPGTSSTANDLSAAPLTRLWQAVKVTSQATADLGNNAPSYIDPKHFADALIDILGTGRPSITAAPAAPHPGPMLSGDTASISGAINHVVPVASNPQINSLLQGIAHRTGGDLDGMKKEIAAWFDSAMDRVSGVYKRSTQRLHFMIALVLAIALNISAIHVAKVLWQRPLDATTMESITTITKENLPLTPEKLSAALQLSGQLAQPIGWSQIKFGDNGLDAADLREMIAGWLITALAALFGAPFWFDMLQTFVRLKASGPSPKEKKTGAGAAA